MRSSEKNLIDNLQTLPKSIFLQGEKGSNFVEICEAISQKFNIPLSYNLEELQKTIYAINLFETDVKQQNILLKLFEEPENYVIIYGQNCIETLKTRSYIIKIPQYSDEDLDTDNKTILKYFRTPELVEKAKTTDINYLENYCFKLIEMTKRAPLFNLLDSINKYLSDNNVELFVNMLPKVAVSCKVTKQQYKLIDDLRNNFDLVSNKNRLIENFIINFWRLEHCQ